MIEDGVVFRHAANEFLLTAAEPNLAYLAEPDRFGSRSRSRRSPTTTACSPSRARSRAGARDARARGRARSATSPTHRPRSAGLPVTISRTGFTGDLGYEILAGRPTTPSPSARRGARGGRAARHPALRRGRPHHRAHRGRAALIDVEFNSSRDGVQRRTSGSHPDELGLGWLLKGIDDATRPFIGRRAILSERDGGTSRWATVGLMVDPAAYDELVLRRQA